MDWQTRRCTSLQKTSNAYSRETVRPVESSIVDNLIIGSGMASLATALALRDRGARFEIIDVGFDLDLDRSKLADDLSRETPDNWNQQTRKSLFPPVEATIRGVERRTLFGSEFPYQVPDLLSVKKVGCSPEFSHSLGGFGSVWGAAALPYSDHALKSWPIKKDALYDSYRNVLNYMPLSAERDGLETSFPILGRHLPPLAPTPQARALFRTLDLRSSALKKMGIEYGRARVAVELDYRILGLQILRYVSAWLRIRIHFLAADVVGKAGNAGTVDEPGLLRTRNRRTRGPS